MQGACKMSSGITTAQLYIPKARKPVESPEAGRLRQNETGKDIHCQRIRKNEGDSKTAQFWIPQCDKHKVNWSTSIGKRVVWVGNTDSPQRWAEEMWGDPLEKEKQKGNCIPMFGELKNCGELEAVSWFMTWTQEDKCRINEHWRAHKSPNIIFTVSACICMCCTYCASLRGKRSAVFIQFSQPQIRIPDINNSS